jgi:hypothetical protein
MSETLVPIQCARCSYQTFRHRDVYTQMMAERAQAWCVLCAPAPYRKAASQREVLDVAQALIAQSRATLADYLRSQRVRLGRCARCKTRPGVVSEQFGESVLCVECFADAKGWQPPAAV